MRGRGKRREIIIFTDLDGSLLDHSAYSFEPALPALKLLKERHVPLVICSSKTRTEIEHYREKLGNSDPFIAENGGGIFIPGGYFDGGIDLEGMFVEESDAYQMIRLGAKYVDLRKAVEELRREGYPIRGFGDMSAEEIAATTQMPLEEARMAKERSFDEPFLFGGGDGQLEGLLAAIKAKGFNYTRGRFHHILGDSDKGVAVTIVSKLYRGNTGDIVTVAIGDSPNDLQMLERVDFPVLVQKPDGTYDEEIEIPRLIRASGPGPVGWNRAVLELVSGVGR